IKHGEGGLSSIQFAVQCLQLRHGILAPPFKRTSRLLSTLRAAGLLDQPSYRSLFVGFQFLRRLEHRMRLAQGRAVSVLPGSPGAVNGVAAAMGYDAREGAAARERMLHDLHRHLRRVETAYRRVVTPLRRAGTTPER